ncbi:RNA-directed DNA polymerase [Vibrio vulnificus]|uniref:reverse transcriptase domain-containing protein n=1 Tax=Vibrio vulnificus TaxID=672 RepID=UPI001A2D35DB|nr:reverse transcriptase domain-containing protein [Vibrio vulnificus]MCA3904983.1 RNA-directed DNA polymerase [Vibrio vulnificus]HAS8471101.1 RNA-directed DNA polymerase [Vibrio vulnificus]
MEQISASANLNHALRRVKRNKGCAGVDRLDIAATISKLRQASNGQALRQSLLDGSYQPQPVLGIEIPKTNGGVKQLGIPTVLDRIVQQAITSVLSDIYEPKFSNSSYGFRPNRSAHHALAAASRYRVPERAYLSHSFKIDGTLLISKSAQALMKKRVRKIMKLNAWKLAMSDQGWWHLALSPQVNHAMPIKWFEERGLYSLRYGYEPLKVYSEPPYATHACTVV